jgi:hypothetical protein
MAEQRQSFGPGRVLGQVTLIVALPLLGGVVAGLVIDGIAGTTPLFVLSGLVIGSLVTILWLRSFITTNAARLRNPSGANGTSDTSDTSEPGGRGTDDGQGHGQQQQRQESAERT